MSKLVFLDTETTGLSLSDDIWEVAMIVREGTGPDAEYHALVEHDERKAVMLPESFLADYRKRYSPDRAAPRQAVAAAVREYTESAHIVGAVPNFDTERLAILLRRHGLEPAWRYHLIDVETLAVGWLAAQGIRPELPWGSDEVSRVCGVEPPGEDVRHTALGDARWARDLYDAVMKVRPWPTDREEES